MRLFIGQRVQRSSSWRLAIYPVSNSDSVTNIDSVFDVRLFIGQRVQRSSSWRLAIYPVSNSDSVTNIDSVFDVRLFIGQRVQRSSSWRLAVPSSCSAEWLASLLSSSCRGCERPTVTQNTKQDYINNQYKTILYLFNCRFVPEGAFP